MSLEERVLQLENENNALREELETTKIHLRKYTAPASSRNHYTKNKTAILEKKKNNPTTSEMRKIYNRRSYLKRKEKENIVNNQKKEIGWGNQIRSYVLHPYKLIKDLRTNHESSNVNDVLDGDIDSFLEKSLSL